MNRWGISSGWIILLAFLLTFFNSYFVSAQGMIRGIVLDAGTNVPVTDAAISLGGSVPGSVSDPWGRFVFEGLPAGRYTLEIKHIGYLRYTNKVNLKQDETVHLDILLIPAIKDLEGIEVTALFDHDSSLLKLPYVKAVISKTQIIQTSHTDIGTYIRGIPNVSGIRKGGSTLDPVVRGFKYGQLNVQLDNGHKIEGGCPNRMDPALAHVELEDLQRLVILKGPYAFRYGPSFGGIIDLQTQKPVMNDRFSVSGSALIGYASNPSGTKEHLTLNAGNRLVYFGLSGNNKQNGDYRDGNGNRVKSENRRYSIKGQVGITPGKDHHLLLSYNYSRGRNVSFPALPMDMRDDETHLMSLDYAWTPASSSLRPINLKLYRSDVTHLMDNKERPISDTVVAVTFVRAINSGARVEGGFETAGYSLLAGMDLEHIIKDGDRTKTLILQPTLPSYTEQIWNNAVITNLGLFTEFRKPLTTVDLIVSARLDYNKANSDEITFEKMGMVIYFSDENESQFLNLSLSTGIEYWINNHVSVGLMLGRGVRSPDMTERFITLLPVGYDNYDYLGNPSLSPEANQQIDLTGRYQDPRFGSLEVNGFYSFVTNYITGQIIPPAEQKPATSGVLGVKRYYNAQLARFRGFELVYGSAASMKCYVQVSAAYTRATLNEAVRHLINANGQVIGTEVIKNDPLAEIPPFESTLVLGYKFMNGKLIPKVKGRLVAHQNFVSEAFYEQTTPGFFVAGFSCSYYHNVHFTITGGIENIFDNAYYEHLNRRIVGSNQDFYEPGRNFFVNLVFTI